jgi:hypothetical protein
MTKAQSVARVSDSCRNGNDRTEIFTENGGMQSGHN